MRKLYRSTRDKKIFGVCGGLAEYLCIDATLIRILLIVVAFFSAGSVILVYLIAGFVIPEDYKTGGGYLGGPYYGNGNWSSHGSGVPPQPPYGNQGWPPGNQWNRPNVPPVRPASAPDMPPQQGLDAMMEDIEKKALKREIEELKAKIQQIEKQSKGE